MDSETRTALIELWRDVPGCKLSLAASLGAATQTVTYDDRRGKWSVEGIGMPCDFDDRIIEALARDAIVCWLPQQANVDSVSLLYATEPNDASTSVSIRTFSDGTRRPKPDTLVFDDPSLLRNLIAAARAVHKGAERGE